MSKLNLYDIYRNMEKEDIILSFKGDVTKDLLSSVYQIMETRIENETEDIRRKKKFYSVLVECLQNMYHHMESLQIANGTTGADFPGSAIFIIAKGREGSYRVYTGNFILNANAELLKGKIDRINAMNPAELKAYYLETLGSTELSEKGGAGLGMIEIARKSGGQMNYDFERISENHSFFTLSVVVN